MNGNAPSPPGAGPNGRKGIALILTLLIVSLLSAAVIVFMRDAQLEALTAQNAYEFKQAEIHALAGIEGARTLLAMDDNKYDALDEPWAKFDRFAVLAGGFFEDGGFTGRIEDLNARFNVNSLIDKNGKVSLEPEKDPLQLQFLRLFDLMGVPRETAGAVLDWLDPDDNPRPGGAERPYYSGLADPYPHGNRAFDSIGQLALVKGMTPEYLYGTKEKPGLLDVLCVHSDGRINVNTAGLQVLMSLDDGLTESTAREIMDRRTEKPFEKIDEVVELPCLSEFFKKANSITRVSVSSSDFLVKVEGRYREATASAQAVVHRSDSGVGIVYYRAM